MRTTAHASRHAALIESDPPSRIRHRELEAADQVPEKSRIGSRGSEVADRKSRIGSRGSEVADRKSRIGSRGWEVADVKSRM
jgi:hypothetical protein